MKGKRTITILEGVNFAIEVCKNEPHHSYGLAYLLNFSNWREINEISPETKWMLYYLNYGKEKFEAQIKSGEISDAVVLAYIKGKGER